MLSWTRLITRSLPSLPSGLEVNRVALLAVQRSEMCISIPMFGMIESLNLGTTSGIVLYEVTKQRRDYQSKYRRRNKRSPIKKNVDDDD